MTTRLRLYAYHVIGAVSFCGVLLVVAPPLAPMAIGFCVVYLAMLAVLYVAGRMCRTGRMLIHWRALFAFWGCVVIWLGMTALDPSAGVLALLLSVVSLWPRRMTV